jgi:Leishmanolysin
MTHLLGFTGSTWKMIREHTGNRIVTLKDDRYFITHKDIVSAAKDYWKCDSVYGLPLENNGGSGSIESHWEKSSFSPDIMTGSSDVNYYYS